MAFQNKWDTIINIFHYTLCLNLQQFISIKIRGFTGLDVLFWVQGTP